MNLRRRVERLEGRASFSYSLGHAHGVPTDDIDVEFQEFFEASIDEIVTHAVRLRKQREPEGHDAPPLDGMPWRGLVALAVSCESLQRVPSGVLEALGAAPEPEAEPKGRPREVEDLEAEFYRHVLAVALERGYPAGRRSG